MIIGVSGKIGSGKDLVGRIIQYIIWKDKVEKGYVPLGNYCQKDFFENNYDSQGALSGWKIKKFADKLKDIICVLLGCARHELESHEFKETELGEQWWYYKGEVGLYPYDTPYEANKKLPLVKLTPRLLLQLLGTQCGRQIIHPNIWVNATMVDYKPLVSCHIELIDFKKGTRERNSKDFPLEYSNWIITDVRFPNEADAIKQRGGIVIRVNRPCKECGVLEGHKMIPHKNKPSEHESETALDDYEFDYIVDNSGTIEELIVKIKDILIERGIL